MVSVAHILRKQLIVCIIIMCRAIIIYLTVQLSPSLVLSIGKRKIKKTKKEVWKSVSTGIVIISKYGINTYTPN